MRFLRYTLILIIMAGMLTSHAPDVVHASTVACSSKIQGAIDTASPGATINVDVCTHFERLKIYKPLHLVGAAQNSTIIDGQGLGVAVIWVNSSDVEIRGFTIRNSYNTASGIFVQKANRVNITGNTVSASPNGDGVRIYKSNSTLVFNNIITGNSFGVNVTDSQSNRVIGNHVLNDTVGVQLRYSSKSLVSNNTFSRCEEGVDVVQSSFNNVTRNLFKRLSYFGILLVSGSSAPPAQFSHNNTVNENTFEGNGIAGISLQNATLNTFYHNDFFLAGQHHVNPVAGTITSPNVWDNRSLGGPIGGNYWDNYNGTDPDGDGIGDTPYIIGAGNQDQRPLMTPFLPVPVLIKTFLASPLNGTAPLTVSVSSQVIGTLPPFSYRWDFGDGSAVATSVNATHTFNQGGNYVVTLTVGDTGGAIDSLSTHVLVNAPPSNPYIVPVVVGVVALVAGGGGFFFWRRRRKRSTVSANR